MQLVADFETINKIDDCRVWAYSCIEIGNYENYNHGTSLDEFMWNIVLNKYSNDTIYFHNLKFDGEFIFYWLFRNGFTHVNDRKKLCDKTFCSLISDKGQFYQIEICLKSGKRGNKCVIRDSLKILNFPVSKIGKDFNLTVLKGEIDYNKERPVGYELDDNELEYIRNDVEVVARALEIMFDKQMDRMTIGSDALFIYKKMFTKKKFEYFYPVPSKDVDSLIRKSYKGGFTYVNKKYRGKTIGDGIVLDVNSLYPSVMRYSLLPIGVPLYFDGKYRKDEQYPLYVQNFSCQFELKKDKIPTIQMKGNLSFKPTEYLESSNDEIVELTLTNVDLKLFFEQYNVYNIEYHGGYKFRGKHDLFTDYIEFWINEKINAKKEKNGAMYQIAKLMLNSLYGKFALNPEVKSKYPTYNKEKDLIKYEYGETEYREPIYIPIGTFITSYAREKTIRTAQKCYDRFCYSDTDSIHLEGLEEPVGVEIDDYKLGAWKKEFVFSKGKYLRQKTYMELGKEPDEDCEEYLNITCAGMPKQCYEQVDFDSFEIGSRFTGKLMPKHVSGGICLLDTEFTIKK